MSRRSRELADALKKRRINMACLQEKDISNTIAEVMAKGVMSVLF